MRELLQLDALVHSGSYRATRRATINDVTGEPVAELSIVPRILVPRCLTALRKARTPTVEKRIEALTRAGHAFATETIAGMSPAEYQRTVSRISGLPISVVRNATHAVAEAAAAAHRTTQFARPAIAVDDWRDPLTRSGRPLWTRRGDVFAVNAAGNHPGVHSLWLEALAMGYRVAVRPSTREPLTPYRLIAALRSSGFSDDQVAFLPTDHAVADELVGGADLAMVFGGDDVIRKYAGSPTVLPRGPGRSKVLLATKDWRRHIDTIVASVADHGGAACINATAVFVAGDPEPVAQAIAERLSSIPALPPDDEAARLPVHTLAEAHAFEKFVLGHAKGARAWLGGDGIARPVGAGCAALGPAVFQVDRSDAPQTRVEVGFPCVWVAPWSPEDGVAPLKDTLVLTAIVDDDTLVDRLVAEPSIRNVYLGDRPTCWFQYEVPHDGYLAEFLMRTKGIARS